VNGFNVIYQQVIAAIYSYIR